MRVSVQVALHGCSVENPIWKSLEPSQESIGLVNMKHWQWAAAAVRILVSIKKQGSDEVVLMLLWPL